MKTLLLYFLTTLGVALCTFFIAGRILRPLGGAHCETSQNPPYLLGGLPISHTLIYEINQDVVGFSKGPIPLVVTFLMVILSAIAWKYIRNKKRLRTLLSASFLGMAVAVMGWRVYIQTFFGGN